MLWRQCILFVFVGFLAEVAFVYDCLRCLDRLLRLNIHLLIRRAHVHELKIIFVFVLSIDVFVNRIENLREFYGHTVGHVRGVERILLQLDEFIKWMINQLEQLVLRLREHSDVRQEFLPHWRLSHINVVELPHQKLHVAGAELSDVEAEES